MSSQDPIPEGSVRVYVRGETDDLEESLKGWGLCWNYPWSLWTATCPQEDFRRIKGRFEKSFEEHGVKLFKAPGSQRPPSPSPSKTPYLHDAFYDTCG